MGKNPRFDRLELMFKQGRDIELTDAQYENITGVMLPKNKSYIKNNSALSRKAAEHGYVVYEVIEKRVILKKLK